MSLAERADVRTFPPAVARRPGTRVLLGAAALLETGAPLDELHLATGAPVTARRPWLEVWARCHPAWSPFAVVVGDHGRLEAAALLARRRVRGRWRVVAWGHGPSDYARLPARTPDAARRLASAVSAELASLGRWSLEIEQVPENDLVAHELARLLPHSTIEPGDPSPVIRFDRGGDLRPYVGRNWGSSTRRARRRMEVAGLDPVVEHVRDPGAVRALLPVVERAHRERDAALGRRSDLRRPEAAAFYRDVIATHAARGEAEVVGLFFGSALAAYEVAFLDGDVCRIWDGRVSPAWDHLSAGLWLQDALLRELLREGRVRTFDWMRGEEPFKLRTANDRLRAERLRAWSSRGARGAEEARRRAAARLRRARDRHPVAARTWKAVKSRTVARYREP